MKIDLQDPIATTLHGHPAWAWPNGKVLPVVAGGDTDVSPTPAPPAPSPPTPVPPTPTPTPVPPTPSESGFPENTPVAEMTPIQQAAYWRDKSRKHEARANERRDYDELRAKAEALDALAEASKTENEKAVAAARKEAGDEARVEERAKAAVKLVDAEMRAAVAGKLTPEQLAPILEPIDRTKFLTPEGEVDNEKVLAFVASIAPAAPAAGKFPNLGQGRHGEAGNAGTPSVQSGRDRYLARHGPKNKTT